MIISNIQSIQKIRVAFCLKSQPEHKSNQIAYVLKKEKEIDSITLKLNLYSINEISKNEIISRVSFYSLAYPISMATKPLNEMISALR